MCHASTVPQLAALRAALEGDPIVLTTGLVVQDLLQGFAEPKLHSEIIERFAALPIVGPAICCA